MQLLAQERRVPRFSTGVLLLFLLIFRTAVLAAHQTGTEATYRLRLPSSADLVALGEALRVEGGAVVALTPEGELLARLTAAAAERLDDRPDILSVAPFAHDTVDGESSRVRRTTARAYGGRAPTEEEQREIDRRIVKTTCVPPAPLSRARAAVRGGDGLPECVDNSLSRHFPPIGDQGGQNACTCWAGCYYFNTYTQARDEKLTASDGNLDVICSPAFIYNLVNNGEDQGAAPETIMMRLNDLGCSSWTLKPYSSPDHTNWPSEAAWIDALKRRTSQTRIIGSYFGCTDGDVEAIKQHLANGNVAVTRADVYENWSGPYPADTEGIDNGVLFAHGGAKLGNHVVTLVGYDDNRTFDDGASACRGAFLVANSWGTYWGTYNSSGAGTRGFMWVAYDYFKENNGAFGMALFNLDREAYRPLAYACVGIDHANRSELTLCAGVGSTQSPDWISPIILQNAGGDISISDDARIAVDLTQGLPVVNPEAPRFFARLRTAWTAQSDASITSVDVYYDAGGTLENVTSPNPTVAVPPGQERAATVAPVGGVRRFEWSPIASTQRVARAFSARVTALDWRNVVYTNFGDRVTIGAESPGLPSTPLVITECGLRNTDYVEIRNVTSGPLDTTGWRVVVSGAYSSINQVNPVYWHLPDSIAAGETLYRTDSATDHYFGANIFWGTSKGGWALIVDDAGEVVDFAAWHWAATDIAAMRPVVDGRATPVTDRWEGDGINSSGVGSIQRVGGADTDCASDFDWIYPESPGTPCDALIAPFGGGDNVAIPITPVEITNFIDGVWEGNVTIFEPASRCRLRAYGTSGGAGETGWFALNTGPVIRATPSLLDFGAVRIGDAPERSVTIENATIGVLEGTASCPEPFIVASGAHYTASPGDVHTVVIRYAPGMPGLYRADLTLTGGGGAVVALRGKAIGLGDEDHDGLSDWDEHLAGTDPEDRLDCLRIEPCETGASLCPRFRWPTKTGRLYRVWRSTDTMATWHRVFEVQGSGGIQAYTDPVPDLRSAFFRVTVEKAD